jgi:hypothetical protein
LIPETGYSRSLIRSRNAARRNGEWRDYESIRKTVETPWLNAELREATDYQPCGVVGVDEEGGRWYGRGPGRSECLALCGTIVTISLAVCDVEMSVCARESRYVTSKSSREICGAAVRAGW